MHVDIINGVIPHFHVSYIPHRFLLPHTIIRNNQTIQGKIASGYLLFAKGKIKNLFKLLLYRWNISKLYKNIYLSGKLIYYNN